MPWLRVLCYCTKRVGGKSLPIHGGELGRRPEDSLGRGWKKLPVPRAPRRRLRGRRPPVCAAGGDDVRGGESGRGDPRDDDGAAGGRARRSPVERARRSTTGRRAVAGRDDDGIVGVLRVVGEVVRGHYSSRGRPARCGEHVRAAAGSPCSSAQALPLP
jgi:hypothetical protein